MQGAFVDQGGLFSYIAPEARVPANHPLRKIRELVRGVLGELNRNLGRLYASEGRPSIPPEQLLSRCCSRCSTASGQNMQKVAIYTGFRRWPRGHPPIHPPKMAERR